MNWPQGRFSLVDTIYFVCMFVCKKKDNKKGFALVLVVLTASAERVSVSRVQDILINLILLEICNHPIFNQTTMHALKRHCGFKPLQAETFDGKPLDQLETRLTNIMMC